MTLPNLFLFAAPRSGSTQLSRWLATHRQISLSKVKEPNFFSAHEFPTDYVEATHLNDVAPNGPPTRPAQFAVFRSLPAYQKLFEPLDTCWQLDASTSYLSCPEAPGKIRELIPDARIIVLTRDPVARAVSHFRLAHRTGRTRATLGQELDRELRAVDPVAARYLLRPSQQAAGIARVLDTFPEKNVLILRFEDMVEYPSHCLAKIATFLEVDDAFDASVSAKNAAALPRFARLNAILLQSGVKVRLRRWLPVSLRPIARRLWFQAGAAFVSDTDLARLRSLLEDA